MNREVPAHYIRENKAAFVPRRLVIMDTETRTERTEDRETQTWRCGAAQFIHWTGKGNIHRRNVAYTNATRLWDDVGDHAKPKQRTIVYCHNLSFDIRISKALQILPELGWRLDAIRIASQGSWSRWSRQGANLTICDSFSLFPVTLYTLGNFQGVRKLALPETDDIEPWLDRCVRDVEILADTMVEYFEWLRTGVAGNWQLTGAGQSWAHWRHAHYTDPVLVHGDDEAVAAEREAMWTGRAESWRWGLDYDTPVYEWDWQNAYPRIARDHELPAVLCGSSKHASLSDYRNLVDRYAVLARVEVTTDQPMVPARHNDRILWPVGTFETVLWDPEINLLLNAGQQVRIKQLWYYKRAPILREWAQWVLSEIHSPRNADKRWMGVLLKHWSRALIGRFATQYQQWEPFGIDTVNDVRSGMLYDADTGATTEYMQVGNQVQELIGYTNGDDACPQVTSYIMSVARAKLWTAMESAGFSNVMYVDTDSCVLNTQGNASMRRLTQSGQFDGLRLKHRHRGYEIFGPRAAIIGGQEKLAGIPRNAYRMGQERWKGEVWTQLARAIRTGEWDRVTITPRGFSVKWNEHRRARLANGSTCAYRLPGYEPATDRGRIPAILDSEKERSIRNAFQPRTIHSAPDVKSGISDLVRLHTH